MAWAEVVYCGCGHCNAGVFRQLYEGKVRGGQCLCGGGAGAHCSRTRPPWCAAADGALRDCRAVTFGTPPLRHSAPPVMYGSLSRLRAFLSTVPHHSTSPRTTHRSCTQPHQRTRPGTTHGRAPRPSSLRRGTSGHLYLTTMHACSFVAPSSSTVGPHSPVGPLCGGFHDGSLYLLPRAPTPC